MSTTQHISQEDLALYAMQALAPEEAEAIRMHLRGCEACRRELTEISGEVALAALMVEAKPLPSGARQRFVDRMAQHAGAAPVSRVAEMPRPAAKGWPLWLAWGAVAAMVVVCVALGVRVQRLQEQLRRESAQLDEQASVTARAQDVMDLLTQPAAQHIVLTEAKAKPAPGARAVYLPSKGALLLQASNLGPIPADKAYELWLIPSTGQPIPAGLFRPDAAGNAEVVLPPLPKGVSAKAFGVTVEKAEGATSPTLPIVLAGAVAGS